MDAYNEKYDSAPSKISTALQRLRLDVEQNAISLAQFEKHITGSSHIPHAATRKHNQLCQFLKRIANAPAAVLRRLGRQLHILTYKRLSKVRHSWKLPRLLIGDVIRFEDALGRRSNLPYQYFKHLVFLRSYLQYAFHGLPGDYQLQRNKFFLSINRSGVPMNVNVWEGFVQPEDHVTMVVYATTPSNAIRGTSCPYCGFRVVKSEHVIGGGTCRMCHREYDISERALRQHIKPRDGRLSKLNVTIQKMKMLSQNRSSYLLTRIAGFGAQDEHSSSQVLEQHDTRPATNVGVSKLKNARVYPTHEPLEIIDTIEGLMDQIATLSPGLQPPSRSKLREAVQYLRYELQSPRELNFLDFESEHSEFMMYARRVIQCLQDTVDKVKCTEAIVATIDNTYRSFAKWVKQHFSPLPDKMDREAESVLVLIKSLVGKLYCFRVSRGLSIRKLKHVYAAQAGFPSNMQYLVYNGRKLENHHTIGECGITSQYYVHVLLPIWKSPETA